jgi:hypothetical protein
LLRHRKVTRDDALSEQGVVEYIAAMKFVNANVQGSESPRSDLQQAQFAQFAAHLFRHLGGAGCGARQIARRFLVL